MTKQEPSLVLVTVLLLFMSTEARVAAVLGGSGAVGKELVRHLVSRPGQWASIVVLNRRPVADLNTLPRVSEQIVSMDSEAKLESETERILKEANVDAVFNTMGVGAPSKAKEEELRRVDLALPAAFARGAKAAGASHFGLLTAVGADASAKPGGFMGFFKTSAGGGLYKHLKGSLEDTVKGLQFGSASTFRPAALIGTPNTPGAVAAVTPFFDRIVPAMYQSSQINTLAAAMVFDAESKLKLHGGDAPASAFAVFEGAELQGTYAGLPFEHGAARMGAMAKGEEL
jgi:NAD(P)-dependent dehydrogenase (short-subunit alcohol dehydrogenase family)